MALVTRKTITASTNASPSHHNIVGDDADTSTLIASAATDTTLSSSCHSSPYRSATRGVLLRLQHARRGAQGKQLADKNNKTSSSNTTTKDCYTSTTTTTDGCTTVSSPVLTEPTRQPAPRPRSIRRTTTTIRQSESGSESRTGEAELQQPQCLALSAPSSLVSTLNSTGAVHTMPTTTANDGDTSSNSKGRRSGARDGAVAAAVVTTQASPIAFTTITSTNSSKSVAAAVGSVKHDEEIDELQGSRCSRDMPSPIVLRQDTRTHSHVPRYTHTSDEDEKQMDKGGKQAVVETLEEDAAVQRDDSGTSCKATTTAAAVVDEADVVVMHAEKHGVRDADTTDTATRYSAPRCALQATSQTSHSAAATRLVDSDSPHHHHHGCAEDHESDSTCHATSSPHTLPVMTTTTTTTSSDVTAAVDMSHTHAISAQHDKSTEQGTPHSVAGMTREVNALLRTRTTATAALVAGEKNTTCSSSSSSSSGCVAAPVMSDGGNRDTASKHTTLHTAIGSSSKKEVQGSAVHDTAYDGCCAVSELRMAHTPYTVVLPCHSPHLASHSSSQQQQQQQPPSHLTHTVTTTTGDVTVSQPPSAHHSPHCLSSLDRWRAAQQSQTHNTITTTTTTTTSDEDERKEEDNVLLVLPSSATPHTPLPCPLTAASSSPSTSHASSSTTTITPATKTTLSDSVRQPCHSAMPHAVCESTACDVLHSSLASPCLQHTPAPTHINTTTTTTGDGVVNEAVVHSSLERWRRTQAAAGVTTTTTASNSGRSSVAMQSSRASQKASARQRSSMPTSPHPPASHSHNSSSRDGRVRQLDLVEAVVLHSSVEGCRSEGNTLVSQENDYACNTAQDVKAMHAECITTAKEGQPTQSKTRDDMKEHGSEGEEREKETHDASPNAPHTPFAVSPRINATSLPASVLVHDTSHANSYGEITSQAEAASSRLVPHAVHANERIPHKAAIEQSHNYYSEDNNKEGAVVKQVGNVRLEMTTLAQQTTHLTHKDNHSDNMHNPMAKVEAGVGHVLQQASHVAHEREGPRLPSHTTTTTTSITDTHSPSPPHSTTTPTHSDTPCDGRRDTVKNSNNAAVVVKGDGSSSVSAQSPSLPSTSVASVAGASASALPKSQYVHDLQAFITRLEQQLSRASFAEAADTAAAPQHTSPKYEEGREGRDHGEKHVICRKSTLHDGSSSSSDDAMAARGQHLTVSNMKIVKNAACVGTHGSVAAHVSSLPRHHPATSSVAQPERTSGNTKSGTAYTAAVIEPRNTTTTTTTTTATVPESKTHTLQQQLYAPRAAVRTTTTGIAAVPSLTTTVVADGEATRARSHTDTHAESTTHPTTTITSSYSAAAVDMDSVTSETDEDVPFWCDRLLLYDDEEEEECRGQSRPAHTTASPCSSDSASVPEAIRRVPRLDLSALYIPDDAFLAERYRIPMPTCETRPDEARLRLWREVGIVSASRNNGAGAAAVVSEGNTSVGCAKPQHRHHNKNNNDKKAIEAVKNEAVACVEKKKDGEVHTAVHATIATSVVETGSIMERLRQHRAQREQRRLASGVAEGNTMKSEDVRSVEEKEDIAAGQTMTSSIAAENERACTESDTPPAPPLRASQQQREEEDTRRGGNATGTRITTAVVVAKAVMQLTDKTPPHDTTISDDDVGVAERTSATLHQADRDHSTRHTALPSHHTIHDTTDSRLSRTTTTTTTLSYLRMKAEGDKGQQNETDSHSAAAVQTRKDDNNDGGVATAPHRMTSSHTNDTAHTDSNNNSSRDTTCQQHSYMHSKDGFESELSGHYGHHFSDASDALDGGRGVEQERRTRMRSLRVQLLLLTCQEQRGRKSIWAEEAMMIERMCRHAYNNSSRSDDCSSMSAARSV